MVPWDVDGLMMGTGGGAGGADGLRGPRGEEGGWARWRLVRGVLSVGEGMGGKGLEEARLFVGVWRGMSSLSLSLSWGSSERGGRGGGGGRGLSGGVEAGGRVRKERYGAGGML